MKEGVQKMVAAFIASLVALIAVWWPPIAQHVTPEVVTGIAIVITPGLVWLIPNKKG